MYTPKAKRLPSGSWRIQLRLDGESISVTEQTEQACVKKARLIKAEHLAGKREKKAPESSMTLGAAIDLYCADRSSSMSPATIRKYQNIKANHWPGLMTKRLDQISPRQWQQAANDMLSSYAVKTVQVSLGMIKSVVLSCGLQAPAVTIKKSSAQKAKDIDRCKFLEPEQIHAFVDQVTQTPYAIPLLLALSSLRISEIDGLDWSDINEITVRIRRVRILDENGQWILKDGAKTEGSVRDVPIFIPQLADAIAREKKPNGKVMTCCQESLRKNLAKICAAAGIPNPGVHGLRHSFASLCAHLQIPEMISQEIGGWENDKTMKEIYTHVAHTDVLISISRLSAFYLNAHDNARAIPET